MNVILIAIIALLPADLPRYLPGETVVYAYTEDGLLRGQWAQIVDRERSGKYYVRLPDCHHTADESSLMSKAEFLRRAECIMHGQGAFINGVPVKFVPPGDAPE